MKGLTSTFVTTVRARALVPFPILPRDGLETLSTDRPPAVLAGSAIEGMRVEGDVFLAVKDEHDLEKRKNVWVNMKRSVSQSGFGPHLAGKSVFIEGASAIGFVYFFEDVETEDGITRRATFDLLKTERTLEEDASFPIGETYDLTSVKDDVLCSGYDGMKVCGERILRCM